MTSDKGQHSGDAGERPERSMTGKHSRAHWLPRVAPSVVACALVAGNVGLLLRRGFHPNLETGVGLLWIASDYALRQRNEHPVAAPRLNAAGVILGSLLLSLSGVHHGWIDWHRVRTPLGYIPAALIVGLQHESRVFARQVQGTRPRLASLFRRPFAIAALLNAYGVTELSLSALKSGDRGLQLIAGCYGIATLFLPCLDWASDSKAASSVASVA